jgi:hypothetical protein
LELYMRRAVLLREPIPTVAQLVHAGPGQADTEILGRRLPFAIQRPTLLPASTIRSVLSDYEGVLVIGGSRTAVLPPELAILPEAGFYQDLLRHVDATEEENKSRVELELLGRPEILGYDRRTTPSFITRPVGGTTEVSYRSAGGLSGVVRIRIHRYSDHGPRPTLPLGRVVNARPYALRSGDRIRIRFVRGAVTVAVPGRAYRSGHQGDIIPVRPYDSQERFDGLVVGKKEVLVDLQ